MKTTISQLIEGNRRYIAGSGIHKSRPYSEKVAEQSQAQQPFVAILSCSDSRISLESVFDCDEGKLFTMRIPGNYCTLDIEESLEFAVTILQVPLILVLGHSQCSAIKNYLHSMTDKAMTTLLPSATQSITQSLADIDISGLSAENATCIHALAQAEKLRQLPFVADKLAKTNLTVAAAIFELNSGRVRFL